MADIYLSSVDGNNADDGSTWALAKATLAAALTAAGADGRVFVDHAHAETSASQIILASPGTGEFPVRILCVDRTGNPEPPTALATTATVTSTASARAIICNGSAYCYGISFFTGSTTNSGGFGIVPLSGNWHWRFQNCNYTMVGTATTARLQFGTASATSEEQLAEFINCKVTFANVSQRITIQCPFVWENTPAAIGGAVIPDILFEAILDGNPSNIKLNGVDLSALGSGKSIFGVGLNSSFLELRNCKLGSSVSIISGEISKPGGEVVRAINSDSADTNYRYEKHVFQGTITQESTIVRTDGASDGTTPISRKMVSIADIRLTSPLESDPIIVWNEETGSAMTATIEVVTDNVTLTDKEAWIEVEYLGTSGFPLSLFTSDRASLNNTFLGTGTNQDSSSVAWTTTGLTTPVKQKLVATFTPQEKGPIKIKVMLAKPSTTMYFCPKVAIA